MVAPYSILEVGEYVSAPYAGKLLAGLGYDVLKVEPPGGDVSRRVAPFYDDEPGTERSGFFGYLNTGKRSVTLDPEGDEAGDVIRAIVEAEGIDLVVENRLDDYGVDPRALADEYDQLSVVSVSGFGTTGPWQEWNAPEIVAAAESGQMNKMGYPDRPPTRLRIKALDYMGGEYAALTSLAALFARDVGLGEGQHVDVSKREAGTSSMEYFIPAYSYSGATTERTGSGYADQGDQNGFPTIFPAEDGYVSLAITTPQAWEAFSLQLLDEPELADDERFSSLESISENRDVVEEIIEGFTEEHGKWELLEMFQETGIPSAVTANPKDIAEFEHLTEREFWQETPLSNGEAVTMPGFPFRLKNEIIDMDRPPRLGEHNTEVYGAGEYDVERLSSTGAI